MGALGPAGESLAASFLARRGLRLLGRNVRTPFGELDLVLVEGDDAGGGDGGALVVCEVKTRRGLGFGAPAESVTAAKRARLARAAVHFARERGLASRPIRFDVVSVLARAGRPPAVEHVEGAFSVDDIGL